MWTFQFPKPPANHTTRKEQSSSGAMSSHSPGALSPSGSTSKTTRFSPALRFGARWGSAPCFPIFLVEAGACCRRHSFAHRWEISVTNPWARQPRFTSTVGPLSITRALLSNVSSLHWPWVSKEIFRITAKSRSTSQFCQAKQIKAHLHRDWLIVKMIVEGNPS